MEQLPGYEPPLPSNPTPITVARCCAPFDPAPWHGKTIVWNEKLFVTTHIHCLLHVPLDMRSRVIQSQQLIARAMAAPTSQPLMLSEETSPWGAELYMEVTRPVPDARMARISGTFLTRVYEGPYRNTGRWLADMRRHVSEQHEQLEKLYFGYPMCPRCAKAYGKNYVVVFAKLQRRAKRATAA